MRRLKTIFAVLLVFSLGAAGGTWAQAFLLPYLASHEPSRGWQFVEEWNQRTTVIQTTRQVVVQEGEGIERVAEQAQRSAVAVQSVGGGTVVQGSGFIATSDGLVLTLASVVPPGFRSNVHLSSQEAFRGAQVLKRDPENNLALLQLEGQDLQTAGFGEAQLGTPVLLAGKAFQGTELVPFVNRGSVSAISQDSLRTTMRELLPLDGAPLFNEEGRVVGLASIDPAGLVRAIPAPTLRSFLGL